MSTWNMDYLCLEMEKRNRGGSSDTYRHGHVFSSYSLKGNTVAFDYRNHTAHFQAGANTNLANSAKDYDNASKISGIDPNLLAAMHMRETSGSRGSSASKNVDGSPDVGPMQISQERWKNDVLPNLTQAEKDKIKELTGKNAEDLNMNNPSDNIIGGALELSQWLKKDGGNINKALTDYQSGGDSSIAAGAPTYANDILIGANEIEHGRKYDQEGI
jgi:hypothetical protein